MWEPETNKIDDIDYLCGSYDLLLNGTISINAFIEQALYNYVDLLFQMSKHREITFSRIKTKLATILRHINHRFNTCWYISDPELIVYHVIEFCAKTHFYIIGENEIIKEIKQQ
jgi:hypothetical protein